MTDDSRQVAPEEVNAFETAASGIRDETVVVYTGTMEAIRGLICC